MATPKATEMFGATIAPPNPIPSYSLEDELELDERTPADFEARAGVSRLTGTGVLVDNGWDRWFWNVDDAGQPDVLTIQLMVAEHITWWKKIDIAVLNWFGSWQTIRSISTINATK